MPKNTPNLNLYKVDPSTDSNDTFNIDLALNNNWDKIDAAIKSVEDAVGDISVPDASLTKKGITMLSNATDGTREDVAATEKAVKSAYDKGKATQDNLTAHLADYVRQPAYATTAGTATTYTVTLAPAPASISEGFGITIIPHVANGASPKLNINGLGAIALKDQKGVAFPAGKLLVGKPYTFRKVGADFLADSGSGADGDATANDLRAGKTATVATGDLVGNLVTRATGVTTVTPTTSGQVLQPGIYDGNIIINPGASIAQGTGYFSLISGTSYAITVDSLGFTPTIVICKDSDGNNIGVYISKNGINTNAMFRETNNNSNTYYDSISIRTNGFSFTLSNRVTTKPVYWVAIA